MPLKKKWTRPEVRRMHMTEAFDPSGGLTRQQWEAARALQSQTARPRNKPEIEAEPAVDAEASPPP